MAAGTREQGSSVDRSNRLVAAICVAFFTGMIGMAYAAVPLYAMFCQITGYGGTTQRVEKYASRVLDRKITVRFDTNVSGGLPWDFKPVARDVTMKIGETAQGDFLIENLFGAPTSGRATFNVTPEMAGVYFNKVECFCFNDTSLEPGEKRDMPVVFYIDPAIADMHELDGVTTITLSYTYFPIEADKAAPAAKSAAVKLKDDAEDNIGG